MPSISGFPAWPTTSPRVAQASAASVATPVELLTMPTRRPPGKGWASKSSARVEELLAAREPEDPGVVQQRVDHVLAAQRRRGVRLRRAAAAVWGPAAFDGEDRLPPRDALRDAREALGVAKRLHVEHHRGRPGVLLPQLEQVVRRDVRAIAERREARDAELPARRVPEQPDAEGAGLRRLRGGRRGRSRPRTWR
jgi:hypothetical protein